MADGPNPTGRADDMKSNQIALLLAAAGVYFAWRNYTMASAANVSSNQSVHGTPIFPVVTNNETFGAFAAQ
jgi:hypothetical protein